MDQVRYEQITRCEAITNIIDSVANQENAIAKLLETIDDKHPRYDKEKDKDDDDLKLINALTRLQFLVTSKLFLFIDCACPNDGCKDNERPWPKNC